LLEAVAVAMAAAAMAAEAMAAEAMAAEALAEASGEAMADFRADTRSGVLAAEVPSGSERCLVPFTVPT